MSVQINFDANELKILNACANAAGVTIDEFIKRIVMENAQLMQEMKDEKSVMEGYDEFIRGQVRSGNEVMQEIGKKYGII